MYFKISLHGGMWALAYTKDTRGANLWFILCETLSDHP